jgi:hypothetical protein
MPTLIIVGNGVQTVEAGNLAPSDTDQLSTHVVRGVLKLSRRSKHTPKKVGDVGNAPHDSYRQVCHHTGNPHSARRTPMIFSNTPERT